MKRVLVLGGLLVVGGVSTLAVWAQQAQRAPSASDLQVDKVRDNLFMIRGGGGNTAAFVTASGVVLVDTKLVGWATPILDKLKEITDKPVTTIINTHTHFDHVGGNVEFAPTVEIVAQENTAKLMQEMRPVTAGPEQPNPFKDKNGQGLPRRTFKDRMTIGSGAERIELYYFGRAHTGGDAWIVFPTLRAMHSGDAFGTKTVPIIDANNGGSGVEYPQTLARAAALADIDTIITGHNPATQTMADLKLFLEFNREFLETVQAAKKSGKTLDDVVKNWSVPKKYLEAGYMTAEEYQKLARMPISTRVRANAEVIWNETK